MLNALVLADADARQGRKEPSETARTAFRQLWETQRPDGAWDWLDFGSEPDESADARYHGAALAALAVGTAPRLVNGLQAETSASNPVGKLRAYLNGEYARQNLYNRTWLLLASSRLAGLLSPEQRRLLMGELKEKQNGDEGWSLYQLGPWRWSKANPPYRARRESGGFLAGEIRRLCDGPGCIRALPSRVAGRCAGAPEGERLAGGKPGGNPNRSTTLEMLADAFAQP